MEDFINFLTQKGANIGLTILFGLIVLIVGFKIAKTVVKFVGKGKAFQKLDPSVQSFLKSAIKVVLYAAVISSTAIIWGIPTTSFLTIFASAGVAVGLALQGSLSNLAGGIMILVFKPFKIGDYIEGAGAAGTVSDITVMYTKLITVDNKVVVIPNGALTNANVTDYSTLPTRRVDLTISTDYRDDIDKVRKVILDVIMKNEMVKMDPAPFVRLVKHNESSLDYTVRVWTDTVNYWNVYFDLTEDIKKAFDENGISIPFKQVDVTLKNPQDLGR